MDPKQKKESDAALIWQSCGKEVRDVKLIFINRTARSFGVQFNLIIPDAKEEIEAAYKNLVAEILRAKSGLIDPDLAAWYNDLLDALLPPSADVQSCQGAIARLDPVPSEAQVNDLEKACVAALPPRRDAKWPSLDGLQDMISAVERVKRTTSEKVKPATSSVETASPDGAGAGVLPAECKYDSSTHGLRCSPKIIVPPGARVPVSKAIMNVAPQNGLLTFTVSFADTADIPSNSTGYLQTAKEWPEPPDSTQWRYSAQLGASWDPDTGKAAENKMFSRDQPYAGDTLQHFVGAGNLKISQKLGSRASATATLGFKKGDLGEKDTTRQVNVPEYALNLYGGSGLQLLFGKYTLATPSSGIAVNAIGEGFELRYSTYSLGYLIKRESTTGEAERSNRDNRLLIAQMKNRPFFRNNPQGQPLFRTLTLVGLYGSEGAARLTVPNLPSNPLPDDPACENAAAAAGSAPATRQLCYGYRYWTAGFEVSYAHEAKRVLKAVGEDARPKESPCFYPWSLSGTLSGYYNGRDLNGSAASHIGNRVKEGRGVASLGTSNYVHFRETDGKHPGCEQEYLIGMQVGYGTGNDPGNKKVNWGYLGESAAFAPDQILLGRLAGHLVDRAATAGGPEPVSVLEPGLSNKLYQGLTFTYNHPTGTFASPLLHLANLLPNGPAEPVSQLTTLRVHHYRFNEPIFGRREAGYELDLELSMEMPKGITTTVDFGKLFAGSALRPVISRDPWLASITIKVDL
ncbi:MAG TPA: hypothetical protein VHQ90_23950 [Thermoanaerobaculia bacterium]|nr:hypothetical protein [Thermoanaerobaculia bacterium]